MSAYWTGKSALVTGAASGIGLALSQALIRRGAFVWMSDIDEPSIRRAALQLGQNAYPVVLDVRDAAAVQEVIRRIVSEHGSIDFLFNNAGILLSGEFHEFDAAHFDRIIDVNIRGVVHGTIAAYPQMVKQRSGHIINTASLAGLAPSPLLSAYAMTKHAVVGLSTSLRFEAVCYGVRVSVLCPAAVDTPLLDAGNPADLARLPWRPDVRRYLERLAGPPMSPGKLAETALRALERNKGVIILPLRARMIALLYRFAPGVVHLFGRVVFARERKGRTMAA